MWDVLSTTKLQEWLVVCQQFLKYFFHLICSSSLINQLRRKFSILRPFEGGKPPRECLWLFIATCQLWLNQLESLFVCIHYLWGWDLFFFISQHLRNLNLELLVQTHMIVATTAGLLGPIEWAFIVGKFNLFSYESNKCERRSRKVIFTSVKS